MSESERPAEPEPKGWSRADKIGVVGLIVAIFSAIAVWLVFFVPLAKDKSSPPAVTTPSPTPPTPSPTPDLTRTRSPGKNQTQQEPTPIVRKPAPIPTPTIEQSVLPNSEPYIPAVDSRGMSAQEMNDRGFEYLRKKDFPQALQWYKAGAEAGHPVAMYSLGRMYETGEGMNKPYYPRALEWYRKAAASGSKDALYGLGHMYDNGEGFAPDYDEARRWYEKAAAQDVVPAMTALGRLYEFGILGSKPNLEVARQWYGKAAQAGDQVAKQRLQVLSAQ